MNQHEFVCFKYSHKTLNSISPLDVYEQISAVLFLYSSSTEWHVAISWAMDQHQMRKTFARHSQMRPNPIHKGHLMLKANGKISSFLLHDFRRKILVNCTQTADGMLFYPSKNARIFSSDLIRLPDGMWIQRSSHMGKLDAVFYGLRCLGVLEAILPCLWATQSHRFCFDVIAFD